MQSLTGGSFPYLGKWEVAGGPPSYQLQRPWLKLRDQSIGNEKPNGTTPLLPIDRSSVTPLYNNIEAYYISRE